VAGIVWKAAVRCTTKSTPLGKSLTSVDAESFAISATARKAGPLLEKRGQRSADNVSVSPKSLKEILKGRLWVQSLVKDISSLTRRFRSQRYGLTGSWLPGDEEIEGCRQQKLRRHEPRNRAVSQPHMVRCLRRTKQHLLRGTKTTIISATGENPRQRGTCN